MCTFNFIHKDHGFRVLILCPSTVIDNWMVEFNKWLRRMENGKEFCAHVGKFGKPFKCLRNTCYLIGHLITTHLQYRYFYERG